MRRSRVARLAPFGIQSETTGDTTQHHLRKNGQFDDTVIAWLAGPPARLRAGAADPCPSLLPDRPTVVLAPDAHRKKTSRKKCGQADATDHVAPHCARHGGARFASGSGWHATKRQMARRKLRAVLRKSWQTHSCKWRYSFSSSSVNNAGQTLVDLSFMKLHLAAVVDIRALRREITLQRLQ